MKLSDLARCYHLIDSPIAYHRCFVAIAESVSGAVFLSQVCYWSRRTKREDGFFYKTAEEWTEETGIPLQTQRRIRERLRAKGILIEKLIGVPATLYFKLDAEALIRHLPDRPSGQTENDQVVNHLDSPSGQTISEITQETTKSSAAETAASPLPLKPLPKPVSEKRSKRRWTNQLDRRDSQPAPREFIDFAARRREAEEKAQQDQYELIARTAREYVARMGRLARKETDTKSH